MSQLKLQNIDFKQMIRSINSRIFTTNKILFDRLYTPTEVFNFQNLFMSFWLWWVAFTIWLRRYGWDIKFYKQLRMSWNKLDFCRTVGIKKLTELSEDEQGILLWRFSLLGQELTMFPSWNCFWQSLWQKSHKMLWSSELPSMQGERWKDHMSLWEILSINKYYHCFIIEIEFSWV